MKVEKTYFGSLDEWLLSDDAGNNVVKVLPQWGGIINSLKLDGIKIIEGFEQEEALKNDKSYFNAVLFPWANRICDGRYNFSNKSFQLPVNEPALNNALHGFVYNQPLNVVAHGCDENGANISLILAYTGGYPGYPFPFELEITITLKQKGELQLDYIIRNTGKTDLPFVLGWHPYFRLPASGTDDWEIRFPAKKEYLLNKRNIPEASVPYDQPPGEWVSLMEKSLNKLYQLEACPDGRSYIELRAAGKLPGIQLWQKGGEHGFNFMMLYTPQDRKTIAIEPMSGCVDAFNNGDSVMILKPGNNQLLQCGVNMLKQ